MTENKRYEIDKDLLNNIECVWDKEKLIGQIEDKETIKKLVDLLNKQQKTIHKLTEIKEKYKKELSYEFEVNEQLIKENKALKKGEVSNTLLKNI